MVFISQKFDTLGPDQGTPRDINVQGGQDKDQSPPSYSQPPGPLRTTWAVLGGGVRGIKAQELCSALERLGKVKKEEQLQKCELRGKMVSAGWCVHRSRGRTVSATFLLHKLKSPLTQMERNPLSVAGGLFPLWPASFLCPVPCRKT